MWKLLCINRFTSMVALSNLCRCLVFGVEERIRIYVEDSKKFLEEAVKEFEEEVRGNDVVRIRDAVEKVWNAIVQSTNALMLKFMDKVPSSRWERRRLIHELEKEHHDIAKLRFRDRYGAKERYLHELVFYEGIIDVEDVRIELEKVRKYIEDVERLASP